MAVGEPRLPQPAQPHGRQLQVVLHDDRVLRVALRPPAVKPGRPQPVVCLKCLCVVVMMVSHFLTFLTHLSYLGSDGTPAPGQSEVVGNLDAVVVQPAVRLVHVDLHLQRVRRVLEERVVDGAEQPREGLGPVHGEHDDPHGEGRGPLELGQLGEVGGTTK